VFENQGKVKIAWGSSFAYAIGLLASDGCLNSDGRHIIFASKDKELVEKFKGALGIQNRTTLCIRENRQWFIVTFGDKLFYKFLLSIGVTPAKSKTIERVSIPGEYFPDFLRGYFDGDGTFYTFRDRRWPNSYGFHVAFASASRDFIVWLQKILSQRYGVKGMLKRGKGTINLTYVKGDTRKLVAVMYHKKHVLCLSRKYNKISEAFEKDKKIGRLELQKQRVAAVAQW